MSFVKNIDDDEIRNGFLVTSDRKRLWNAEIELILEFQRICDKHDLKWFATGGTLLGAVRHKGFIPWDDDVDLVMPRADYDKFKSLAPKEVRYPFYFDLWYENEDPPGTGVMRWPIIPFAKLRNSQTLIREFPKEPKIHQGIFVDIFPLDPLPPFEESKQIKEDFSLLKLLFMISCKRRNLKSQLSKDPKKEYPMPREEILWLLDQPLRDRGKILEDRLTMFDHESKFWSIGFHQFRDKEPVASERQWWKKTIYLPFEKISIPAPKEFEKVLDRRYGDWKKIVKQTQHARVYSTTISSEEYFAAQK